MHKIRVDGFKAQMGQNIEWTKAMRSSQRTFPATESIFQLNGVVGVESLFKVPGQPAAWVFYEPLQVLDQSGEVFKGIGTAGFAGLDQAHEDISDTDAIGCLVKQAVFSVEDGLFKDSFAKVMPPSSLCRVAA